MSTPVTEAGLKHLATRRTLRCLCIQSSNPGDAGLRQLGGLTSLESLSLWDGGMTDEVLKQVAGLRRLRRLILVEPRGGIGDAGVAHVARR